MTHVCHYLLSPESLLYILWLAPDLTNDITLCVETGLKGFKQIVVTLNLQVDCFESSFQLINFVSLVDSGFGFN